MKAVKICIGIAFIFLTKNSLAQSFAINTDGSVADASAMLDIKSTAKGLLIPRLSKAQKNAITLPATGLLIFQTVPDSVGFHYYDGAQWLWINALNTNGWKTTGNTGTDTAVNFMGTTDNVPLHFKVNNQVVQRLVPQRSNYFIGRGAGGLLNATSSGQIAIGDSAGANLTAIGSGVYIGHKAGKNLLNGPNNIIIGASAGLNVTSGSMNNLFGVFAGRFISTGSFNTFIGHQSGDSSTTALGNTAVGILSLANNKQGRFNTSLGYGADVGQDSLVNASAIGNIAFVDTSNALVLGSISGINSATANTNVAIGTSKPKAALHVSRGSSGNTLTIPSSRISLFEDNSSNYLQLLSPDASETGILAGNASTLIKSGIVFTADSAIQLRAGGNGADVHINKNGLVGIGNTNPQSKLHVTNGATPGASYFFGASSIIESNSNNIVQLMNPSTSVATIISGTDLTSARSSIFFNADSSIAFNSPSFSSRLAIKNNGDVTIPGELGIGNVSPQSKLHVSRGTTTGALYFGSATSIFENSTANYLQLMNPSTTSASILSGTDVTLARSAVNFNADSSISFSTGGFIPRVTIDNIGNTGIFTTTPTAKLDVNGTFKLGTVGTVNTALLKNIITIDVGSVPANGELDVIVAFANAAVNGAVNVSPTTDLPSGIIIGSARVSSAGNIKIRYRNLTGAAIDPASISYIVSVVQ